jgi:hypothetical protein
MSLDIFPDNAGYQLSANSISQDWTILGAAGMDEWQVRAALLAIVPSTNGPPDSDYAWPRRGLNLKERETTTGVWKFSVTWGTLVYQVSGKIGGQQQQVRTSKFLRNIFGDATKAPSTWTSGAAGVPIGWDGRTVHGCSIFVPMETWTESVEIPIADFTTDYKNAVRAVTRSPVNDATFRGLDPGEVLFLGLQYQISTQNPDYVTGAFEFSASQGLKQADGSWIKIGAIDHISKQGWDYLEPHMPVAVDPTNPVMVPTPDYVLIHQVYLSSDFSTLNIGTDDDNLPLWQGSDDDGGDD